MCHAEDRIVVSQALERSYRTGADFQCEYRVKIKGGMLRWFNDKARVIMDKYGRPLSLQGMMTDITDLKMLEADLMHYRGMLDMLVRERTERLERRVHILESCNSSLGENYHKVYQMYLDLLAKTGAGDCLEASA